MYYLKQKIAERDEQWKQDYQLQSKCEIVGFKRTKLMAMTKVNE